MRRPSNIIIGVLSVLLLAVVTLVPWRLHGVQPEDRGPDPRLEQLPLRKPIVLHVASARVESLPRG